MRIQINSDKNIGVDDRVISFIEGEVNRVLKRFTGKLTRLEIHLSDVNSDKPGTLDKRCLIEARPAGYRPLAASGAAPTVKQAVGRALTKLRNVLQTFFDRHGKTERGATPVRKQAAKKAVASTGRSTPKRAATTKKIVKKKVTASARSPKKKAIFQARRKGWPRRPG